MTGIFGQDWASYQSAQPSTSGLSFAFIKVTEGLGYTNPRWSAQRDHAKAAGLVTGFYHYPHMHDSAQQEADFFLSQVTPQPGDLVVLDWEGYDAANAGVSAAAQVAYKEAFLAYLKSRLPHNPVGTYMNVDYWRRVDTTGHVGDFLWIATAARSAGDPGIAADWLFHQYTDQPVDSDYCHLGSTAELRAWAMSFAQATPQGDIVTPDDYKAIAAAVWDHPLAAGQPDGTLTGSTAASNYVVWGDVAHKQVLDAIEAAKVTPDQISAVLLPEIQAAITASKLTPEQIAAALVAGTLHVELSVKAGA